MTVASDTRCSEAGSSQTQCFHCRLPIPLDAPELKIDGVTQKFCCHGCKLVTETILAGGLAEYYRRREKAAENATESDSAAAGNAFDVYDTEAFAEQYVRTLAGADDEASTPIPKQCEIDLLVDGMNCTACVWLIENYLQQQHGVVDARIAYDQRRLHLRWQSDHKLSNVVRALSQLGYRASAFHPDAQMAQLEQEQRAQLRRLGVAFIGMMQVGMFAVGFYSGDLETRLDPQWDALLRWISLLVTAPILLYSCQPFFASAWRALKARHLNMDVPVSLSIGLAFVASTYATLRQQGDVYFDAVTMFAFLLLLGRYIETRARANFALFGSGKQLLPSIAWQIDENDRAPKAIATAQIKPGMLLQVRPHEIIPADGVVVDDAVFVDEAAFTGESEPVRKQPGDRVLAGTLNGDTRLLIKVTAAMPQSQLQKVVDLVALSHRHKPRIAQIADRYASHFVALILLTALVTYVAWQWIDPSRAFWVMLAVLAVSCPCALSLATPAALTAATTALRKQGILVTSSHAIEALPDVDHFVFDKTGTLTEGNMDVVQTTLLDGAAARNLSATQCSDIAAALEHAIAHPIAQAFTRRRDTSVLTAKARDVTMHTGLGVSGRIDDIEYRLGTAEFAGVAVAAQQEKGHWVYLAANQTPLAAFCLADHLRASAKPAIDALRAAHRISLLTGDRSSHASDVAAALAISDVIAGASPQQKLEQLQAWQRRGDIVAMVGDGINDAPVIGAANVSIAVANASDIAKTHADCVLLSPQLTKLQDLKRIALRTRKLIRQNLAWALAYNVIAIPAAACGFVQPWLAAVGMSLSSLVVVLNASRLAK